MILIEDERIDDSVIRLGWCWCSRSVVDALHLSMKRKRYRISGERERERERDVYFITQETWATPFYSFPWLASFLSPFADQGVYVKQVSHYIALGNTPKRWLGKWIISKLDLSPLVVGWTAMAVSSWSSLGYQIFVTSPTLRWNFQSRPGRTRHRTVGSSARSKSSDFTCGFYRGDEAETPSLTWKREKTFHVP